MVNDLCPCGSGNVYQACCQPYLAGTTNPSSPDQLMRSRYTAFCRGDVDYLIATRHPSKRQGDDRQDLSQTIAMTKWLNLRVLHSQEAAETGTVEFVAFFKAQGQLSQLHERSDFVCQDGRWYYLEGKHLPPLRLERNDPCWCGSGKKVKKCHGA